MNAHQTPHASEVFALAQPLSVYVSLRLREAASMKFSDPDKTVEGKTRAWVDPIKLQTLWFNTGTLCNLECKNCYIESSPRNGRLAYIGLKDVREYLDEVESENLSTQEIAFTGGEPFMNPEMLPILKLSLERGFSVLLLTNAMKPMQRHKGPLIELKEKYGPKLNLRVSLDHYSEARHVEERGSKAWKPALEGLQWLSTNGFAISVAGRTLWGEEESKMRGAYAKLFKEAEINVIAEDPNTLVLFPEMDEKADVPEITTECWGILHKSPNDIMCASSRMIVKRKGQDKATVVACTLLPYSEDFDYGHGLKAGFRRVKLNHPHCAAFCVLGGASCTNT